MKPEDKDLLLKDLCARLPYQVKVSVNGGKESWTLKGMFEGEHTGTMLVLEPSFPSKDASPQTSNWQLSQCKPYLRPMSSMTEEEREFLNKMALENSLKCIEEEDPQKVFLLRIKHDFEELAYLYEHHYDVFGLIPAGLALSAETFNSYVED